MCAVTVRRASGRLDREGGRLPDLDRPADLDQKARNRDIRRRARSSAPAGQSAQDPAGRRPPRLHQGHRRPASAGLRRTPEDQRIDRTDTVLVQLATPSRERVESYRLLRDDIERQVGRINGEYGDVGRPVVQYLHRAVPQRPHRVLRGGRRDAGDTCGTV